jgi:hypothetical protein
VGGLGAAEARRLDEVDRHGVLWRRRGLSTRDSVYLEQVETFFELFSSRSSPGVGTSRRSTAKEGPSNG